jgi:hypothetical protein
VLIFALSVLAYSAPLPPDGATLLARSVVKSEDGKHSVQLATFGFPLSESDRKFLLSIMNSDPYLHHFRPRAVFLAVGEKSYKGGPRLVGWHPWTALVGKAPPQWPWTCSFVLPADVDLTGKLTFHYRNPRSADDEPGAEPFANLEVTEKSLKAATVPLRATVTATGKGIKTYAATGIGELIEVERHFVVFEFNHKPAFADITMGDAPSAEYAVQIFDDSTKRYRQADGYTRTFKEAPRAGAAVRVKFPGREGWYKAETVWEKRKGKT